MAAAPATGPRRYVRGQRSSEVRPRGRGQTQGQTQGQRSITVRHRLMSEISPEVTGQRGTLKVKPVNGKRSKVWQWGQFRCQGGQLARQRSASGSGGQHIKQGGQHIKQGGQDVVRGALTNRRQVGTNDMLLRRDLPDVRCLGIP